MNTFRFRKFKVYADAKRLNLEIFRVSKNFPSDLRSQVVRSSLSVVLNIAEGSAKTSDKDFNRYLENALGSVNETVAGLEIAFELQLLSSSELERLTDLADEVARQLGGLSKKLKSS